MRNHKLSKPEIAFKLGLCESKDPIPGGRRTKREVGREEPQKLQEVQEELKKKLQERHAPVHRPLHKLLDTTAMKGQRRGVWAQRGIHRRMSNPFFLFHTRGKKSNRVCSSSSDEDKKRPIQVALPFAFQNGKRAQDTDKEYSRRSAS